MALYFSTLIQSNIIDGNENVELTQTTQQFKELLNSLGTEKLVICSLNLWSNNRLQLIQPITFVKTMADGQESYFTKIPQLDSFQTENVLNNFNLNNYQFNEDSTLRYEILPESTIYLQLNFDGDDRDKLSLLTQLGVNPDDKIENLIHPASEEEKEDIKKEVQKPKTKKTIQEKKKIQVINHWWIPIAALGLYILINHMDKKMKR
jgi:hypothetical protein